jgi:hypothetical protein
MSETKRRFAKPRWFFVVEQPVDGRARRNGDSHPLAQIDRSAIPGTQKRGAHGTRRLARWTVHHTVNQQRVFIAEEPGEGNRTSFGDELEVLRNLATQGQRVPLRGHALDVPAQFNFFRKKLISGGAVFRTFIWKMSGIGGGKLPSR